ncbi:DUF4158 domain-containing protein [Streptomyces sp. NPDC086787]|uniref:DUF4158 domain-containing protein n=1 Tax=Streptomyces sp. NPDC086787 TaxID=3365759 RepID=UPI0037F1F50D
MTSIERTAYPRFKRLITAHELHLFCAPTREEAAWAAERMDSDGHQLALLLALKSYQRMGRFPKPAEYPEMVVDFVRRAVELPEGTLPLYEMGRTAERQRAEVRSETRTCAPKGSARPPDGARPGGSAVRPSLLVHARSSSSSWDGTRRRSRAVSGRPGQERQCGLPRMIPREAAGPPPVRDHVRFTVCCPRRGCAQRARWRGRGPGRARS